MQITRRSFVTACGAAALASAGQAWAAPAKAVPARRHWAVSELTKAIFDKHVGTTFSVKQDAGPAVVLRLASVEAPPPRPTPPGAPKTESFSLLFHGAKDTALEQGMAAFDHAEMGGFEVFMTAVVSRDPETRCYEVVFNRLVQD